LCGWERPRGWPSRCDARERTGYRAADPSVTAVGLWGDESMIAIAIRQRYITQ